MLRKNFYVGISDLGTFPLLRLSIFLILVLLPSLNLPEGYTGLRVCHLVPFPNVLHVYMPSSVAVLLLLDAE
jgi:hypothetical protein